VVPQYFLAVGGGVARDGAHFGRLAAKLPVRRVPEAVERLVALYGAERAEGETPESFFRRVEPARIKAVLADLERLSAEDAVPSDFVDLGDDADFKLETMEGECSA
jgi:sulfite reductase (NADPH) hemoprotein beta-component